MKILTSFLLSFQWLMWMEISVLKLLNLPLHWHLLHTYFKYMLQSAPVLLFPSSLFWLLASVADIFFFHSCKLIAKVWKTWIQPLGCVNRKESFWKLHLFPCISFIFLIHYSKKHVILILFKEVLLKGWTPPMFSYFSKFLAVS